MSKKYIFALLAMLLPLSVKAQFSTASTDVLTIPSSVRATASGGENVSIDNGDAALGLHNPALLSNVAPRTLSLDFLSYSSGSVQFGADYVHAFGERHIGAAYAHYTSYGSMDETDVNGTVLGSFTPKDIVLGVGYSYLLNDHWSGGANLKMAYSAMADFRSFAMAVDVGVNYILPEENFSLGIVARNVGAQLKYFNENPERVPFSLQAGFTKNFGSSPFRINLTMVDLTRWSRKQYYTDKESGKVSVITDVLNHFVVGVDYAHPDNLFWISAGYNFRRASELKAAGSSALAGITAGAGINLRNFSFGLSYARYHKAWNSVMGSVSYSF